MRLTPLAIALLTATLAACSSAGAPQTAAPTKQDAPMTVVDAAADARFSDLSKRWLDGWLLLNPVNATQQGDHRFDAEIDDLSAAGRAKYVDFSKKMLAELDTMDAAKLSRENQIDAAILRNQIQSDIWGMDTLQAWAWTRRCTAGWPAAPSTT